MKETIKAIEAKISEIERSRKYNQDCAEANIEWFKATGEQMYRNDALAYRAKFENERRIIDELTMALDYLRSAAEMISK